VQTGQTIGDTRQSSLNGFSPLYHLGDAIEFPPAPCHFESLSPLGDAEDIKAQAAEPAETPRYSVPDAKIARTVAAELRLRPTLI